MKHKCIHNHMMVSNSSALVGLACLFTKPCQQIANYIITHVVFSTLLNSDDMPNADMTLLPACCRLADLSAHVKCRFCKADLHTSHDGFHVVGAADNNG